MPGSTSCQLDWESIIEALVFLTILAFVIERALAIVFENRIYIERIHRPGLKELIALALSLYVAFCLDVNVLRALMPGDGCGIPGYFITGALIAGGSKASVKLFHDIMDVKSSAYEARYQLQAEYAAQKAVEAVAKAETTASADLGAIERRARRAAIRASTAARSSGSKAAQRAAERAAHALNTIEQMKEPSTEE